MKIKKIDILENSKNTKNTTTKLHQRKYVLIYQIYQTYNDTSYHSFFHEIFLIVTPQTVETYH